MSAQRTYEPTYSPRFRLEDTGSGQRIVVPAQRSLFVGPFLLVWLCGWTFGGFAAGRQLLAHFHPFLAAWLCFWVAGEAYALTALLWMATGKETLKVVGGDLEVGAQILGFARRKLYRGAEIRDLSSSVPMMQLYGRRSMDVPIVWAPRSGGVKFTYGARTVYAGVGLDEAEGRMIVDLLKRRLPKTA